MHGLRLVVGCFGGFIFRFELKRRSVCIHGLIPFSVGIEVIPIRYPAVEISIMAGIRLRRFLEFDIPDLVRLFFGLRFDLQIELCGMFLVRSQGFVIGAIGRNDVFIGFGFSG